MNWISVKDKLPNPKKHESVLTFEYILHIITGEAIPMVSFERTEHIYVDKHGVWTEGGGQNITHWMPLPEPPTDLVNKEEK